VAASNKNNAATRLLKKRCTFLGVPFDLAPQRAVLDLLAESVPERAFRYVVTPNVDYVVRMSTDPELRDCVRGAWLSVCDSRPIVGLARLIALKLPLVTGSDLTVALFRSVINKGDKIAIVASSEEVVQRLRNAYPGVDLQAIVPPLGLREKPDALQACVDFVVQTQARFVFLAVGSPQSDVIACRLSRHPQAKGIGLNIGASLEFLVGVRSRAPLWVQRLGLEWLHRLLSDPKRLWRRYCYAVVPLIKLFSREVTQLALPPR
jgi:exopolysaccharide biosynthesis WecB/TagA/CpsF family protein